MINRDLCLIYRFTWWRDVIIIYRFVVYLHSRRSRDLYGTNGSRRRWIFIERRAYRSGLITTIIIINYNNNSNYYYIDAIRCVGDVMILRQVYDIAAGVCRDVTIHLVVRFCVKTLSNNNMYIRVEPKISTSTQQDKTDLVDLLLVIKSRSCLKSELCTTTRLTRLRTSGSKKISKYGLKTTNTFMH